jgi:hypothetical protein
MLIGYQAYSETIIRYYDPVSKTCKYSRDHVWERKQIGQPNVVLRPEPVQVAKRSTPSAARPSSTLSRLLVVVKAGGISKARPRAPRDWRRTKIGFSALRSLRITILKI